jgi:hypothetical protein
MLATMDEYRAQDEAVEQARDRTGFDEVNFRAGFGVGYTAGRAAGYTEGYSEGFNAALGAVDDA